MTKLNGSKTKIYTDQWLIFDIKLTIHTQITYIRVLLSCVESLNTGAFLLLLHGYRSIVFKYVQQHKQRRPECHGNQYKHWPQYVSYVSHVHSWTATTHFCLISQLVSMSRICLKSSINLTYAFPVNEKCIFFLLSDLTFVWQVFQQQNVFVQPSNLYFAWNHLKIQPILVFKILIHVWIVTIYSHQLFVSNEYCIFYEQDVVKKQSHLNFHWNIV